MSRRLLPLLLIAATALALACGKDAQPSTPAAGQRPADGPPPTVQIIRKTATKTPPAPTATPAPQLCLVTRTKGVTADHVPPDLITLPREVSVQAGVRMRRDAAEALLQLIATAREEGQQLLALSGYRSFEEQTEVLKQEIRAYGEQQARRQVAEPGHSEHQLGVAIDVTSARKPYDLTQAFGGEPEGQWLAKNADRFGFVVSYPAGKESITGYIYEPWHIRYVGVPLAEQIVASGQTITEYLSHHKMDGCEKGQ